MNGLLANALLTETTSVKDGVGVTCFSGTERLYLRQQLSSCWVSQNARTGNRGTTSIRTGALLLSSVRKVLHCALTCSTMYKWDHILYAVNHYATLHCISELVQRQGVLLLRNFFPTVSASPRVFHPPASWFENIPPPPPPQQQNVYGPGLLWFLGRLNFPYFFHTHLSIFACIEV